MISLLSLVLTYFLVVRFCIKHILPLNPQYQSAFKLISFTTIAIILIVGDHLLSIDLTQNIDFTNNFFSANKIKYYSWALLSFTAPPLTILLLNKALFHIQPKSQVESNILNQISIVKFKNELEEKKCRIRQREKGNSKLVIYISKWFGHQENDFYYILINNTVISALQVDEYTEIEINQNENILGCYAIPTRHSDFQYRYSYMPIKLNTNKTKVIEIKHDIIFGSSFNEIEVEKLSSRLDKLRYNKPGLIFQQRQR